MPYNYSYPADGIESQPIEKQRLLNLYRDTIAFDTMRHDGQCMHIVELHLTVQDTSRLDTTYYLCDGDTYWDDYYEDLIPQLYKPAKVETMGKMIAKEQELEFKVEQAQEPEPAADPEPIVETNHSNTDYADLTDHGDMEPEAEPKEAPKQQTIVERWKGWLNSLMKDVTE